MEREALTTSFDMLYTYGQVALDPKRTEQWNIPATAGYVVMGWMQKDFQLCFMN